MTSLSSFGAIGGAATCGAVLTMFVGALREATMASVLFGLFGLAVVCALCAIAAFTVAMLLTGTGIRAEVAKGRRSGLEDAAVEAQEPQPGDVAETQAGTDAG